MNVDHPSWPELRFGVIGDAWRLYKQHALVWALAMLIVMAATGVVNGAIHIVFERGAPLGPGGFRLFVPSPSTGATMFIASTTVSGFFLGGMVRMAGRQIRGGAPRLEDLFSITDCWFDLVLVAFLIGAGTFIGCLLCLIPGFIVLGVCLLAIPLVVEGRLPATGALIQSWHSLKSQWLTATVFHLVLIILAASGLLLCFVGVFATGPLYCLAVTSIYHRFFGWGALPAAKKHADPFREV
jgi:uncharacterized membrane protein